MVTAPGRLVALLRTAVSPCVAGLAAISPAGLAGRSVHRYETDFSSSEAFGEISSEIKALLRYVSTDYILETWLIDRDFVFS